MQRDQKSPKNSKNLETVNLMLPYGTKTSVFVRFMGRFSQAHPSPA
jgi:hypothetical protein